MDKYMKHVHSHQHQAMDNGKNT